MEKLYTNSQKSAPLQHLCDLWNWWHSNIEYRGGSGETTCSSTECASNQQQDPWNLTRVWIWSLLDMFSFWADQKIRLVPSKRKTTSASGKSDFQFVAVQRTVKVRRPQSPRPTSLSNSVLSERSSLLQYSLDLSNEYSTLQHLLEQAHVPLLKLNFFHKTRGPGAQLNGGFWRIRLKWKSFILFFSKNLDCLRCHPTWGHSSSKQQKAGNTKWRKYESTATLREHPPRSKDATPLIL